MKTLKEGRPVRIQMFEYLEGKELNCRTCFTRSTVDRLSDVVENYGFYEVRCPGCHGVIVRHELDKSFSGGLLQ